MKRSEINAALREMEQMVREYRFALPPLLRIHAGGVGGEGARLRRDPGQHAGVGHHRLWDGGF